MLRFTFQIIRFELDLFVITVRLSNKFCCAVLRLCRFNKRVSHSGKSAKTATVLTQTRAIFAIKLCHIHDAIIYYNYYSHRCLLFRFDLIFHSVLVL